MTEESAPTDPLADESDEGTDDQAGNDTGAGTQRTQQPNEESWEKRYRDVQQYADREAVARRRAEERILAMQAQGNQPVYNPGDPLAQQRAELEVERARLRSEQEWAVLQRDTPPEVMEAYLDFQRGFALDPSPRGAVTAFTQGIGSFARRLAEAQEESGGDSAPPDRARTRDQAVQPRVDTSRSDAPDPEIQGRIAGAQKSKNLLDGVKALFDDPSKRFER